MYVFRSLQPTTAGAKPRLYSMKRSGVLLPPPTPTPPPPLQPSTRWDASPHGSPSTLLLQCPYSDWLVFSYSHGWRETMRSKAGFLSLLGFSLSRASYRETTGELQSWPKVLGTPGKNTRKIGNL